MQNWREIPILRISYRLFVFRVSKRHENEFGSLSHGSDGSDRSSARFTLPFRIDLAQIDLRPPLQVEWTRSISISDQVRFVEDRSEIDLKVQCEYGLAALLSCFAQTSTKTCGGP